MEGLNCMIGRKFTDCSQKRQIVIQICGRFIRFASGPCRPFPPFPNVSCFKIDRFRFRFPFSEHFPATLVNTQRSWEMRFRNILKSSCIACKCCMCAGLWYWVAFVQYRATHAFWHASKCGWHCVNIHCYVKNLRDAGLTQLTMCDAWPRSWKQVWLILLQCLSATWEAVWCISSLCSTCRYFQTKLPLHRGHDHEYLSSTAQYSRHCSHSSSALAYSFHTRLVKD